MLGLSILVAFVLGALGLWLQAGVQAPALPALPSLPSSASGAALPLADVAAVTPEVLPAAEYGTPPAGPDAVLPGQLPVSPAPEGPAEADLSIRVHDAGTTDPLVAAFEAYSRGDLELARARYARQRQRLPGHPDPLLGLAAIAWREGKTARAAACYREILALDPGNASARAGLAMLSPVPDTPAPAPAAASPGARAAIRYASGRANAAAGRWSEAHVEFAAAFELQPTLADYALALAISLDHLGLGSSARETYRQALALRTGHGAAFTPDGIERRIAALANAR
jgi:tetratricopeptide (TPR) repeat protein